MSRMCALLEAAHQREERDVEEDRAPVELLHHLLEVRRLLDPVAQDCQHQHQRQRAGHAR